MLTDYVVKYANARSAGDKGLMADIERDLEKVGMDKITLGILADEVDAGNITAVTPRD